MRVRRPLISTSLVAALLASVIFSGGAQAAPGDLDPTFSGDGKQTADFPQFGSSSAAGTVRQPDGKIVAVGRVLLATFGDDSFHDFALARHNPDGTLDTSFSGDGRQRTNFAGGSQADAVALQSDGKIVVVGTTGEFPRADLALARYNPNGSLDTSFSGDGKQTTDFGASEGARGVAIQGDGRIVVVGAACTETGPEEGVCDFALARFFPNGSLDTTFSGDGKQTTDFGTDSDSANGIALQADGKIVAVGARGVFTGTGDFALARYNASGSLDTSFSGDGKQTTEFGGEDRANGVALQGDGKIVAVGQGGNGSFPAFALARYNLNGSLDTSFSGDGKQTTDFGAESDAAAAVALRGDGGIVAVGRTEGAGFTYFALARYNTNGSLDTSFSGDGRQTTDLGGGAAAVALQGDGKIVAVGETSDAAGTNFGLARYNANGSLDPTFSGDGKQTTGFGGFSDRANGVALQGDGKIVVVGHAGGDFALTRHNPNGSPDPTFSGNGRQTTDFGGSDEATGVAVQANGKIVVVGHDGLDRFALGRYNPNGTLDTSFSGDGKQTTGFARGSNGARGVALQGDGKIVAVGSAADTTGSFDFALARYNTNGSLDTSFSGDGKQTTGFAGVDTAAAVAVRGDGKIAVVGEGGGNFGDFALARYNPNGSPDTSFSGDGKQTTDFGGFSDRATGVALQTNGKMVAVGGNSGNFALARYNLGGSLDPTFSGDGKQTTDFGASAAANGVALQGDGKIVAVGRGPGISGYAFALARYNPNGSLDPSFSGDGKQATDFGVLNQVGGASGVALQGDGKIIAVGIGRGPTQTDDFAIARYLGG